MSLRLVPDPDYRGAEGLAHLHELEQALAVAVQSEDWSRVRELDRACASLVERIITANRGDRSTLVRALSELKGVYANTIELCQQQASGMAL